MTKNTTNCSKRGRKRLSPDGAVRVNVTMRDALQVRAFKSLGGSSWLRSAIESELNTNTIAIAEARERKRN